MTKLSTVELPIPIGLLTEPTARGTKGRYKDCDKIRFRQGLPEKLGGWILASIGSTDGDVDTDEDNTDFNGASVNYGGSATVITMDANIDVLDGDPVLLYGDSTTGGLGTRSIASGGGDGSYIPVTDAGVTAAIGDVVLFELAEEFVGVPASIISGGLEDDVQITLDASVNTYLKAGTILTIALQAGGFHHTTFSANLTGGAVVVSFEDPLPSDATLASSVQIWAAGSEFLDFTTDLSYIFRTLANAPAATTQLILTEALPENVGTAPIDIRPFQQTAADGDQAASATLTITPATDFAITSNTPFPNGFIVLPTFLQEQICYEGFSRALHDWSDLSDQQWLALGTDTKLYVVNGGTLYDITPIRDTGTLIGPFDTVSLSTVVTVNDAAHGVIVGDSVRFTDGDAVAGLDLNDEFIVQTVPDPSTYTITAAFPADSLVSGGGGTVSYEYDITIGFESGSSVSGWGTGAYGADPYGIGTAGTGILQALRIWSLDNFGEDLLASPNEKELYHWDRSAGPTIRSVVVPQAPATIQRMLISPQARHVIAFGAGTGSQSAPGSPDKLLIRWCDSEDFSDWIATTTNLAGDLRLDVGSQIITAIESRGDIIIFTDESLHALQFIGGTLVFGLRHLGQSVTIIGANAAVDVNGIVLFMGQDDFLIYDGVLRVLDCDVRNQVFDDLNEAQGAKVYCGVNKLFTEVWWLYPSSASNTVDRYVKWNYKDNVWDFGTLERTAWHDSSRFLNGKPYATQAGKIYQHETGVDDTDENGVLQAMSSRLESGDMEIDPNGMNMMHIGAMIPDFKELTGSIDLTLRGRGYPQRTALNSKGPFTITSLTERQSLRMRSRQISFLIESDALGDDWRMGTWRAELRPHGRRGGV
jgi:hypothetical protein